MSDETRANGQKPGENAAGKSEKDKRAARLAAALKANLGRRKAAARAGPAGAEETGEGET